MPADKTFLKTEGSDFLVDGSLDASHVCQDAVIPYEIFQLGEIGSVAGNRGTQENIAAAPEIIVDR